MPEMTGGLAKMAVASAAVATAMLGYATPSHAAEQKAPVTAAYEAHGPAAPAQPPAQARQNQGHYLSDPLQNPSDTPSRTPDAATAC
ncbi:hypothetical protein ACGF0D_23620 [Kitasatospora sp. NPDC048298]|uniref:hypothetical protein n=1 Tax=Kitasatospora sp. NPDC048298 TaxID=3364049 RepID=UPI00371E4DDC